MSQEMRHGPEPEIMNVTMYPSVGVIEGDVDISNGRRFTVSELERDIERAKNSYLLSPRIAEYLGIESNSDELTVESSSFHIRPDWAVGREDSAYGVYFGELDFVLATGETKTVPVAAKHFPLFERDRAEHEYAALELFSDNKDLKTFSPVGFWVNQKGEATLLTVFEEDVVSLDNHDWSKTGNDPLNEHYDLVHALQKSAQILSRLHARGFAHRDAQVKNMAIDRRDGSVRLIDLTTLEKLPSLDKDPELISWQQAVYKDLSDLVRSVRRAGYLKSEDPEQVRGFIDVALLSIHASMIRHPATRYWLPESAVTIVEDVDVSLLADVV